MRKYLKVQFFLFFVVSIEAATMFCRFPCNPSDPAWNISTITQPNEPITVLNPPFTPYVETTTTMFIKQFSPGVLQYFPRRLFDIFINLSTFIVYNISFPELGTESIYNCQNLLNLQFHIGVIPVIAARFALTCSKLINFTADSCNIEIIDENAFEGLTSLEIIDLKVNKISCIPPRLFQSTKGLNGIYLHQNRIVALHPDILIGLTKLQYLWLQANQIVYIPSLNLSTTGTYNQVASMDIFIQGNPIIAMDPTFMATASNTRVLNGTINIYFEDYPYAPNYTTCVENSTLNTFRISLLHNFILGLSTDWSSRDAFFKNSTSCYSAFTPEMKASSLVTCGSVVTTITTSTTLSTSTSISSSTTLANSGNGGQCATEKICRYYLDWNDHYTCVIDGAVGTVTSITGTHYLNFADLNVTRVYFKNSYLSLVPKILFQKFPNLKFLHISNCGLNIIDDKTFTECGVLELLDISDNDISRIDETALTKCISLQIIDLSGNPINFVSQGLYEVDPALKRVHLRRLDDWTLAKRR